MEAQHRPDGGFLAISGGRKEKIRVWIRKHLIVRRGVFKRV
jgi:hypothetical protein